MLVCFYGDISAITDFGPLLHKLSDLFPRDLREPGFGVGGASWHLTAYASLMSGDKALLSKSPPSWPHCANSYKSY